MIESLKEKYGEIFEISVKDEDSVLTGYFKRPDYNCWKNICDLYSVGNDFEADAKLAELCFVGGDEELIDFDENIQHFLNYRTQLAILFNLHEVKIIEKTKNTVKIECDGKTATFKLPTFKVFKLMIDFLNKDEYFKADEFMVKYGWVEGDEELKNINKYPHYFVSYRSVFSDMIQKENVSVKKK